MADNNTVDLKNIAQVVADQVKASPVDEDGVPVMNGPVIDISVPDTITKTPDTTINPPIETAPVEDPTPIEDDELVGMLNETGPMGMVETKENPLEGNAADAVEAAFREAAADLPEEEKVKQIKTLRDNIAQYKKDLIMNFGMSPEDADKAAIKKSQTAGYDANTEWLEKHPKTVNVTIDKAGLKNIEFSDEEREKLRVSKAINLVVIDDEELKHIEIDSVPSTHKIDFLRRVEGSGSTYEIPLPLLGDMVTFKGATVSQMLMAVDYENTSPLELLKLQSELIYDRMIGGSVLRRWNENYKNILSYDQFMNSFPFHDIDMALYAILVASSTDSTEATLPCDKCSEQYTFTYNAKTLLKMDGTPEHIQNKIGEIVGNKGNQVKLTGLHKDNSKVHRFKGPVTGNIYDISYPTLARIIKSMEMIDDKDPVMAYRVGLAMYMKTIYLPNPMNPGHYIAVKEEDMDAMLDSVASIQENEGSAIAEKAMELYAYKPQFLLTSECTHCKNENKTPLTVSDLVFLRARDMGAVMQ